MIFLIFSVFYQSGFQFLKTKKNFLDLNKYLGYLLEIIDSDKTSLYAIPQK